MSKSKKNIPEEEKNNGALSEARKAALLRYLAILFAFAFLLVAVSLVVQMRSSNATILELNEKKSSALSNAEALQAQNRELQDRNEELQDQVEVLSRQMQQLQLDIIELEEQAEAAAEATNQTADEIRELEKTVSGTSIAYEALLTAKSCDTREGNVTYSRAMETLEQNKEYLDQTGLQEYQALLEENQEEN